MKEDYENFLRNLDYSITLNEYCEINESKLKKNIHFSKK